MMHQCVEMCIIANVVFIIILSGLSQTEQTLQGRVEPLCTLLTESSTVHMADEFVFFAILAPVYFLTDW